VIVVWYGPPKYMYDLSKVNVLLPKLFRANAKGPLQTGETNMGVLTGHDRWESYSVSTSKKLKFQENVLMEMVTALLTVCNASGFMCEDVKAFFLDCNRKICMTISIWSMECCFMFSIGLSLQKYDHSLDGVTNIVTNKRILRADL
jgi:hypothetical protein